MKDFLAAIIALSVCWTGRANAALVTFDFTSVQSGFLADLPIPNGSAFSGSFTLDTAVPGGSVPAFEYYQGVVKTVTLGPVIFDVSGWSGNNFYVFDNYTFGNPFGVTSGVRLQVDNSETGAYIDLRLYSSNTQIFSSTTLPSSLPDISNFDQSNLFILEDSTGSAFDSLTSIAAAPAVPEPDSSAIFVIATLGMLAWRASSPGTRATPVRMVGA
jgi:hypothetical protein